MDRDTVMGIIVLWGVLSTILVLFYGLGRKRNKDITYAEILLCIICLPGLLINLIAIPITVAIYLAWETLDRPIKKRQNDQNPPD